MHIFRNGRSKSMKRGFERGSLCSSMLFLVLLARDAWAAEEYQAYVPPRASGGEGSQLFVVLAYSAIWFLLLAFVVSLWHRQRRIEQELDELRRQLGGAP
jgi:CcmD family protein